MFKRVMQFAAASLFGTAILANAGCCQTATASCKKPCEKVAGPCARPSGEVAAELPPHARPGECYAKVWVAPKFETVTERIMVRPASERLEIIPAEYTWVEERVCVKEASTRLVEEPAQFADKEVTIQVEAPHTEWVVNKGVCDLPKGGQPTKDVFCLVNYPPAQKTVHTQCLVKPATVKTECIPAEFDTVRRQKLVHAATTKRICIPAEFETVEKTIKVCDGRMAWQRVTCEKPLDGETATIKTTTETRIETDRDRNLDRD